MSDVRTIDLGVFGGNHYQWVMPVNEPHYLSYHDGWQNHRVRDETIAGHKADCKCHAHNALRRLKATPQT